MWQFNLKKKIDILRLGAEVEAKVITLGKRGGDVF